MTTYSFADSAGMFTGASYSGPDDTLDANKPAGCLAVEGLHDRLCRRVDLQTGAVVPWQPPAPADDELRTWAWNADAERWLPTPTLAALRADRTAPVLAALQAHEARQARPQGDILAAMLAASTPAQADVTTLQAIRATCATLRGVVQQMQAATTAEQLAAITWSDDPA